MAESCIKYYSNASSFFSNSTEFEWLISNRNVSTQNEFLKFILEETDQQSYFSTFSLLLAPIYSFTALAILIFIIFTIQIILSYQCDIRYCQRDFRVKEYNQNLIVCVDLAAAIVSFIILIVCPIGIFLVNKLEKLDDRINCSLLSPWDFFIQGNSQWIGIKNFQDSFQGLLPDEETSTQLEKLKNSFKDLPQDTLEFLNQIDSMEQSLKGHVIDDPNQNGQKLVPYIIQILPNKTTNQSVAGSLQQYYWKIIDNGFQLYREVGSQTEKILQYILSTTNFEKQLDNSLHLRQLIYNGMQKSLILWGKNYPIIAYISFGIYLALLLFDVLLYVFLRFIYIPQVYDWKQQTNHTTKKDFKIDHAIATIFCNYFFTSMTYFMIVFLSVYIWLGYYQTGDWCIVSEQKPLKSLCSGDLSENNLAQSLQVYDYIDSINKLGQIIEQLDQRQLKYYPNLINEWLAALKNYEEDPSIKPTPINTFNGKQIQLESSNPEVVDVLYQLQSWASYTAENERQYSIMNCKVLQDEISFSVKNCKKNKQPIIADFFQGLEVVNGTNITKQSVCFLIVNPDNAKLRVHKALEDRKDQKCVRIQDPVYATLEDNYYKRFNALYQYKQQFELEVVYPLRSYLLKLQELEAQYEIFLDQYYYTVKLLQPYILIRNSRKLLNQSKCDLLDIQISYQENFLCKENMKVYFENAIMLLVLQILGFLLMILGYYRTSQKYFEIKFDQPQVEFELFDQAAKTLKEQVQSD